MRSTPQHPDRSPLGASEPRPSTLQRGSGAYSELLQVACDAPDALHVLGCLDSRPCVAVVGSRACSGYGRRVATRLAEDLAGAGINVVSGLARGIDAAAHRGCLRAGGKTIAVLPGGLHPVYPRQHCALARRIVSSGALVAEHAPGTEVARWHFPKRNRIIAALSWVTVVVEAAARSGARITANLALDYGREVLVVPGPITSSTSAGCHALLADGAHPCTGVADVLDHLPAAVIAALEPSAAKSSPVELDPAERSLLELLRRRGRLGASDVARLLEWSLVDTLATVTRLELHGRVRILPGNNLDAC